VFQTHKENVLLIQEEDPMPILQDRLVKVGASKGMVDVEVENGQVHMTYDLPDNLYIVSNQGFTLDEVWLEQLELWIYERQIKLVILDPLMMVAGAGFDEFKAFEFMEKVLKPLKRLRAKTQAAIVLVHHHIKGSTDAGAKAMYGSVALWAWEEAALHLQVTGVGKVVADRFSKHALLQPISIEIGEVGEVWAPKLIAGDVSQSVEDVLMTMETGATIEELMGVTGMNRASTTRQLHQMEKAGKAEQGGRMKSDGGGRPRTLWRYVR
jgi:hypothetical protein